MGDREAAPAGARILVVDDEVMHLRALDQALHTEGYQVTQASSVPAALEAIETDDIGFHAAVVDYMLLDRKGSEVVKALCGGKRFTASIVLTANESTDILDDVYRSGVYNTLLKPVRVDELLPELKACVQRTIQIRHQYDKVKHASKDRQSPHNGDAVIMTPGSWPSAGAAEHLYAFARREDRARGLAKKGGLSEREREVLLEVFTGRKNAAIAERLQIAERTVKFHISNINKKLSVRNRGELMALLAGDPEPDILRRESSSSAPVNGQAPAPVDDPDSGPDDPQ